MFRNSIQDGTKIFIDDKNVIWWYCGKFVEIENTWTWSNQNCSRIARYGIKIYLYPMITDWKRWWREVKIRNFDYEFFDVRYWEIETDAVVKSRMGLNDVERENLFITSAKKKTSLRKETNTVSDMRVTIAHKNRSQCRHIFWVILVMRPKCVEEKNYPRQKYSWSRSSTIVPILFERILHASALWILISSQVSILPK